MLKSKKFNIVLAILAAVVLWAYVLGEVNPNTSDTIRGVPITFANEDMLEAEGLTILQTSAQAVNIHISGNRNDVNRVEAGDFTVICDVEGLQEGESTVRLTVTGPDTVTIDRISEEKITVTVDELVTAEKNIEVVISGEVSADQEPYVVETSSDTVQVTGAATLIDRLTSVNAIVDVGSVTDEMRTLTLELVPVDEQGSTVENVALSQSRINVTIVMMTKKTVALDVPVTNQNAGGFERTVDVPKTIVIKGTEEDLAAVDSISCETVDLAGITEDTEVRLTPVLPEGIQVSSESEGLSASVTVKPLSSATFTFDEGDIQIINRDSSLTYTISPVEITVNVTGTESVIEGLQNGDLTLTVDAADLETGTSTVPVVVTCDKGVQVIESSVSRVEITIE